MTNFETLYDLSIELLTSTTTSAWTVNHCDSSAQAEDLVRSAVLTTHMPGEDPSNRWGIVRIFMRNLVNRAQAPLPPQHMVHLLSQVEASAIGDAARITALVQAVAATVNEQLSESLEAFLDPGHAPEGSADYIDWIGQLIAEYSHNARYAVCINNWNPHPGDPGNCG